MPPKRKTLKKGSKTVRTFRQETDFYCGPACAKMTLRWLGVTRSQEQLWDVIQDEADAQQLPLCERCGVVECAQWYTPPEALARVIAGLGQAPVKLVSEPTAPATDHAVVWSLVNDIPAVALVFGRAHWLVVHGYHVDREPANIDDTGYQLLGFDVIDPFPKRKARVFINGVTWRTEYMTGVRCGRFDGRYVAVCDPEPRRSKGGPTVPTRRSTRTAGEAAARKGSAKHADAMVGMRRAGRAAVVGIERAGLLTDPVWRTAMRGTTPQLPQVVHRLDRPRSFYMLVPFQRGRTVTAQALVDAYSGEMLTARAGEDPNQWLEAPLTPEDAIERVARRRYDLPGMRPQLRLRREGLSVAPGLVWKPCKESLSPYVAFMRVLYGDRTFYVRADGEVFTELTEAPGGA